MEVKKRKRSEEIVQTDGRGGEEKSEEGVRGREKRIKK